ncbi:FkbM family methyltransferase [Brevundimonas naejangsanensis]
MTNLPTEVKPLTDVGARGPDLSSPSIPENQIQVAKVFGETLFGLKNERIFSKLLTDGIHERVETALVPQFARFGSTVLDIGANIGYYSAWLRHAIGPQGHVHAFEANPATAALFRRTMKENGWSNVTLNEVAVSDAREPIFVEYVEDFEAPRLPEDFNLGGWTLVDRAPGCIRIDSITIDDYVKNHKLPRISFIKIDVEGYESRVLKGALHTIITHKPIMLIELLAKDTNSHKLSMEIVSFLDKINYVGCKTSSKPVSRLVRMREEDYGSLPYHFYIFCMPRFIADDVLPLTPEV